MASFLKLYIIALPISFALDMFWIGVVAKNLYFEQIGALMKPEVNWIAAVTFYVIFIAGLVVFVLLPAVKEGSGKKALLLGALFGFVSYATYDLTNLAIAKDWPLLISIVDMVWGGVLAGVVSTVTYALSRVIRL